MHKDMTQDMTQGIKFSKNMKFTRNEEGGCTVRPATRREILGARKKVREIKSPDSWQLRSCYECNGSHAHLMDKGIIIQCFSCGRWFVDGIDVMDYSK